MKKNKNKIIVGILILIVLGFGLFAYSSSNKNNNFGMPEFVGDMMGENTVEVEMPSVDDLEVEVSSNELENVDILFGDTTEVSDGVEVDSENVVTIKSAGEYVVSGTTTDGMILVDAGDDDEIKIVLNGVYLENKNGPAIYIKNSGDVKISTKSGSVNYISDAKQYDDEFEDVTGAIYSTSDLDIKGKGKLVVYGKNNDGIVSKDDLDIENVNLEVYSADDGIRGKDSLEIKDATVVVVSEDDALKSDNDEDEEKGYIEITSSDIKIDSGDDGISAINTINIQSGNVVINNSYEGIETKVLNIYGGYVEVHSEDDALNITTKETSEDGESILATGAVQEGAYLNIYGGEIVIYANTGDGFDSNGQALMEGGSLVINGPTTDREGALDVNGDFVINGGTVIASGSSGMLILPSDESENYTIMVAFDDQLSEGTEIYFTDSSGEKLFDFETVKVSQSIVYSSPELELGETYSVFVDGEKYADIEVDQKVTQYGDIVIHEGGPGDGGGPGMGGPGRGQRMR